MGSTQTKVVYQGLRPTATDGRRALRNPERGLRFEIGTGRLDSDEVKHGADAAHWPFQAWLADGVSVGQGYCYLTQFHDSPISDEKLEAIQRDFDRLRGLRLGAKFLLRFAYEFDGVTHGPTAERISAMRATHSSIPRYESTICRASVASILTALKPISWAFLAAAPTSLGLSPPIQ